MQFQPHYLLITLILIGDRILWLSRGEDLSLDTFLDVEGVSMAITNDRICALSKPRGDIDIGGEAVCWGITHEDSIFKPPKQELFVQVRGAASYFCGLTVEGTVKCWGELKESSCPPKVPGIFRHITGAGTGMCGLLNDGSVHCWGALHFQGSNAEKKYVQVSCADHHCCALDAAGDIHCWGSKASWQAAIPPLVSTEIDAEGNIIEEGVAEEDEDEEEEEEDGYMDEEEDEEGRRQTGRPVKFIQISAAQTYTCGIRLSDQAIECWGESRRSSYPVRELPGPFRQVSAGRMGVCGVYQSNDSLVCVGKLADVEGFNGGKEWDQVSVGDFSMCAVSMDSELTCWGSDPIRLGIPADLVVA